MNIERLQLNCINPTVPTVFGEELSYLEVIGKVQLKVNELIVLIETIKPDELRAEMSQLRDYVNSEIEKNKSDINTALENNLKYVMVLLDSTIEQVNDSLRNTTNNINVTFKDVLQELYYAIDNLSANIRCINVVKGQNDDISSSVRALYDTTRLTGLTALQYDELLYDARSYDSFRMSARKYDSYSLLVMNPYFKDAVFNSVYFEFGSLQFSLNFNTITTNTKLYAVSVDRDDVPKHIDGDFEYNVLMTISGFKENVVDISNTPKECGWVYNIDIGVITPLFIRKSGNWDRQILSAEHLTEGTCILHLDLPLLLIERT